jgi:two-component system, LuxR family, sensor kinase FixL
MAGLPTNGPLNGSPDADPRAPAGPSPAADGGREVERLSYQELFEFAFDGQLLTDGHGIILEANHAASAVLRCPKEFLIGKPLGLFVSGPDQPAFYSLLLRRPAHPTTPLEVRVGTPRSEPRDVVIMAAPATAAAGDWPYTYRWVLRDVTGTRRAERELRWEKQVLQGVVDGAGVIILVVDQNGRILRSNPYLHDVSGYEATDLRARAWCELLLLPEDRPAGWRVLGQALAHGAGQTGPLGLLTRFGSDRPVVWSARGLPGRADTAVVLIGHDVADLMEAQAKAVRAERLAAIGEVAAGLAHESRNALQRGQSCLTLLEFRLKGRPEELELLDRARKAQDDLHRLYEGVLSYAAPLRVEKAVCDLAAVWREAWADLSAGPGWEPADLAEDGDPGAARCPADAFQMKRVFRNLFENARAAVPDRLRVAVGWAATALPGQPVVRVSVRDNGPGFPPTARGRLFDAFFTTKTRGTGLGLALCKRIVEEHGGRIEVGAARPGAEIVITLPRSST